MNLAKVNVLRVLGLAALVTLLLGWAIAPTGAQQGSLVGGTVYAPPGTWVSYSPVQLGANAITLPASGPTAHTNIIDTRGARELTLLSDCSQVANIIFQPYYEDGNTFETAHGATMVLNTGVSVLNIGVESNLSVEDSNGGTAIAEFRLPQRAVSFSWANKTATAGTCTARLFVQY